jgi:hypothetical protein
MANEHDGKGNLRVTLRDASNNPLGGTVPLTVKSSRAHPTVSFTRPADILAYAAKDAVANATSGAAAMEFTGAALATGGGGVIARAVLQTGDTTNAPRLRLHLYSAPPTVISGDNTAFVIEADDRALYVGFIDFGPPQLEGTNSERAISQVTLALDFFCAATSLFGRLETLDLVTTTVSEAEYLIRLFLTERY